MTSQRQPICKLGNIWTLVTWLSIICDTAVSAQTSLDVGSFLRLFVLELGRHLGLQVRSLGSASLGLSSSRSQEIQDFTRKWDLPTSLRGCSAHHQQAVAPDHHKLTITHPSHHYPACVPDLYRSLPTIKPAMIHPLESQTDWSLVAADDMKSAIVRLSEVKPGLFQEILVFGSIHWVTIITIVRLQTACTT